MSDTINCMPIGLVDRAGLANCPTTHSLLTSLAIFNGEVALLSLILGYERVRRVISKISCFPSTRWTPFAAIVTTIVSIIAMLAATYLLRNNGFSPNPFMLFGFWTMRPRATSFTLLFYLIAQVCFGQKGNQNAYLWSLKDHVVEDTLLNVFSLPFALWYILHRPDSLDAGLCSGDSSYLRFWNSFYAIAGAGGIATFLLVVMLGHACASGRKNIAYNPVGYVYGYDYTGELLSKFWRFVFSVAGINMIAVFATSWVIWSTFVINAGSDFCPGVFLGRGSLGGLPCLSMRSLDPF